MSQHFVQAAEEFRTERNQDDCCSAVCQSIMDISQSADVVREVFNDIQADNRVEILILGKRVAAGAIDVGHIHVRASGAKRFKVVQISRIYVSGPIGRSRHQVHGHVADAGADFEDSISYVRPNDVCHPFVEAPGEAAFYGPKLDVQIKDAIGREFSLSTNQIDFLMPERFGLEYVTSEQSMARPVMIHRAPIGSMERFMAYLIETYAGAFPVWLAPVQLVFIPIADRHLEAVGKLADRFRQRDLRVEVDGRSERMQAKIRDAQLQKTPYMAVVGDKELEAGTLNIRRREGGDQESVGTDEFLARLEREAQLPLE